MDVGTIGGHEAGQLGVVVIGRNEGSRLPRCLISLLKVGAPIIYVDSGSSDGSSDRARNHGVKVVDLDPSRPFTAARARNEGFRCLMQLQPTTIYVQFIDGDCEVMDGWFSSAIQTLQSEKHSAAVAGRRRERDPYGTKYNLLCDIEWDTPVGEAKACGGDALVRVSALMEVGGYDPSVIAAEDDDLCVRLRQRGWKILRINADMTLHDADMTTAKQWWKRQQRCGYAFAQVYERHKKTEVPHFSREIKSVLLWGATIPTVLALLMPVYGLGFALSVGIYGHLAWRVAKQTRSKGYGSREARLYGIHCALSKVPQVVGLCRYWFDRYQRRQALIIEYK
jgi:GT2 family glycosyltransferase